MIRSAIILAFLLPPEAWAQADSNAIHKVLNPVLIETKVIPAGNYSSFRDSLQSIFLQAFSVQELLSIKGLGFVRNYGPGQQGTLSAHGATPQQTSIIWNGFTLNSAMHGSFDFSNFPASFFSGVREHVVSNGTIRGNGAIGSCLELEQDHDTNLVIQSTFSTTGIKQGTISKYKKKSQWYFGGSAHGDFSANRYTYLVNQTSYLQEHAGFQNVSGKLSAEKWKNNKPYLSIHLLSQRAERSIPALETQSSSRKAQHDASIRILGSIEDYWKDIYFKQSMTYADEWLDYADTAIALFSRSRVKQIQLSSEASIQRKIIFIHGQGQVNIIQGFVDDSQNGYTPGLISRASMSTTAGLRLFNQKSIIRFNHRVEQQNTIRSRSIPSINLYALLYQRIILEASAGKVFRFATWNDLYWPQGGNQNLHPEEGFNYQINIKNLRALNFGLRHLQVRYEVLLHARSMKKQIVWIPSQSGNWEAINSEQTQIIGCDPRIQIEYQYQSLLFQYEQEAEYCDGIYAGQSIKRPDGSHAQMLYTPLYTASGNAFVRHKWIGGFINWQYYGFRYTSTDNTDYLPPYRLWNTGLSIQKKISKSTFSISLICHNLFDESYRIIAQRPNPGRNFSINIQCKL